MSAEPIPPGLSPPGPEPKKENSPNRSSLNRFLVWGLTLLLLLLLALVILVLPGKFDLTDQAAQTDQAALPRATTKPVPKTPSTSLLTKNEAEHALQNFLRLRANNDLNAVELWAPEPWSSIMQRVDEGDTHYGYQRYQEALQAYEAAANQLIELQEQRPRRLTDALTMAEDALMDNHVEQAISSYQTVLAMQEGHPQAEAGLARAQVREEVLVRVQEGRQAQAESNLQLAQQAYLAAIALDADFEPPQIALQEVEYALEEQAFSTAMSRGLASIQTGNLKGASEALKIAATIRPDDPALRDARVRLQEARRQSELIRLSQQVNALATQEKWQKAVAVYKKALAIDPDAGFARTGLEQAEQRNRLHQQLDHYLNDPERLFSDEPLKNARMLLEANPAPPPGEPRLATRLSALRETVRMAMLPVQLHIESDALTEVSIYHVGRLGTFQNREMELSPGEYTVVGSRNGYRDVRKIVKLVPGTPVTTVLIRCEEPI